MEKDVQWCRQIRQIMGKMSTSISSMTRGTFTSSVEHYCVGKNRNWYRLYALNDEEGWIRIHCVCKRWSEWMSRRTRDQGCKLQKCHKVHLWENYLSSWMPQSYCFGSRERESRSDKESAVALQNPMNNRLDLSFLSKQSCRTWTWIHCQFIIKVLQ